MTFNDALKTITAKEMEEEFTKRLLAGLNKFKNKKLSVSLREEVEKEALMIYEKYRDEIISQELKAIHEIKISKVVLLK